MTETAAEFPFIKVRINTSGMQPQARRAVGNVAIVGSAGTFGTAAPNVPLQIGSVSEAREKFTTKNDAGEFVGGPLYHAVRTALLQDPAPSRLFAVRTADAPAAGGAAGSPPVPGYAAALAVAAALPVQLVCLAGETDVNRLKDLKKHVEDVSAAGNTRMGVAMVDPALPLGGKSFAEAADSTYGSLKSDSSRMILVAARVEKKQGEPTPDVAAAVTGAIAGHPPHASVLLKPVNEVKIPLGAQFTGTEIHELTQKFIIPVIDPELIPGEGLYLGSGRSYTTKTDRLYVDVVRVLDHIEFLLKAGLIGSIGETRIDRLGMQALRSRIDGILSPLVTSGVITAFTIGIPLLSILEAEEAGRTPGQVNTLTTARTQRTVEVLLSVTYAGAVHFLDVNLAFKAA
ncbi:hypothetical protein ACM614_14695 [Streptomyces sp. 12297]|uniref:hypothetical protein n=1 Tax=Streptomyces sp. NBC_00239 TaxID=2903640 RepID=UPI002E2880B5|nr:hypothetical protein [Streptomyces sp. NBC_00239]